MSAPRDDVPSPGHGLPTGSPREGGGLSAMLGTVTLGLKVLAGELKWLCLKGLRGIELRQMKKRLDEEHAVLGRAVARRMAGWKPGTDVKLPEPDADIELSLKQVDFLVEEIRSLEEERSRMRQEFVARRRTRLGVSSAATVTSPDPASTPGVKTAPSADPATTQPEASAPAPTSAPAAEPAETSTPVQTAEPAAEGTETPDPGVKA